MAQPTIADSLIGVSTIRSGPKRVEEAGGDAEGAAVGADVLAEHEDPLVLLHLVPERLADGLEVGDGRPSGRSS